MPDFYDDSDKAIELLRKKLARRGASARSRMLIDDFDELNVIEVIGDLYADLERDNEQAFYDLMILVYKRAKGKGAPPSKAWLRRNILKAYDPVTLYVYLDEIERKKARTTEAVIASVGNEAKEIAFTKALRYWADMTAEYCDTVTFETVREAFRTRGVEYVVWRTQEDERVCSICAPRDGVVYALAEVPSRPHWKCRCTIEVI